MLSSCEAEMTLEKNSLKHRLIELRRGYTCVFTAIKKKQKKTYSFRAKGDNHTQELEKKNDINIYKNCSL